MKIISSLLCIIVLLSSAYPFCVDPSSPEGKCTQCGSLDVLLKGNCYPKIRGCLRHEIGLICLECQFGYVLNKNFCIREAVFSNKTQDALVPSLNINIVATLSLNQITNKIGQAYGLYFTEAHDYFLRVYGNKLKKGLVRNVKKLETKKGVVIIIDYFVDLNDQFLGVAIVEREKFVKEIIFEPLGSLKKDPFTAETKIRQVLGEKLQGYYIYQYKLNGEQHYFDYMNSTQSVIRVSVDRNMLGQVNFKNKLTVKDLTLQKLGLEFYQSQNQIFGDLSNLTVVSQKYGDFYVIKIGNSWLSFTFREFSFIFNKIFKDFSSSPQIYPEPNNFLGGFFNINDAVMPTLLKCMEAARKQFSILANTTIEKAQYQSVQGKSFIVKLNSQDNITFVLYVSINLLEKVTITQLFKNGIVIFSNDYNYNQDSAFFLAYKTLNVSIIPKLNPISSVFYRLDASKAYYKAIYSENQFAQFEYISGTNAISRVLSYTIKGVNILASPYIQFTASSVLKGIIKKDPNFNQSQIKDIFQNGSIYMVTFVNSDGTYKTTFQNKGSELQFGNFTKVSDATCFEINKDMVEVGSRIQKLQVLLSTYNPFEGYSLQVVQTNVGINSTLYRFLYANYKHKQIELYAEDKLNTLNIINANFVNYGLADVLPSDNSTDYSLILNFISSSNLSGNKKPIYVEANYTHVVGYYDDSKSTIEVVADKIGSKNVINYIANVSYTLLPQNFTLATLLLPGNATTAEAITLGKISQEVFSKYSTVVLKNASLAFAEKVNNTYNLMFKISTAYHKINATIQNGAISVGKLVLTPYNENNFSNCKKFSLTGKCLSCNENTEIEYQGKCFPKLQGCLYQAGDLCVKCNSAYIKLNSKCYKECASFFQANRIFFL